MRQESIGKDDKMMGVKVLEITFKGRMLWILEDFAKICLLLLCFLFLCVFFFNHLRVFMGL